MQIGGIEADFHAYSRFFSRAVRRNDDWKLASFHVFFERDELHPVRPGEVPQFDEALLASMRPSYRYLCYLQKTRGVNLNMNMFGDDRWGELGAFHNGEDEWLAGKS